MRRGRPWQGGISWVLTLAMLICMLPVGVLATEKDGQHFPDVGTDYALYDAVEWGFIHGIISGYKDGNFYPGNALTCGAFAKMVTETFQLAGQTTVPTEQEETLAKHGGAFTKQVAFIRETADSKGTLTAELEEILDHPTNTATRRHAITILAALTDVTNTNDQTIRTFPDADENLTKQVDAIKGGMPGTVISGFDDGTLCPDEPLTRGQGIALCAKYFAVHLDPNAKVIEKDANLTEGLWGNTTENAAENPAEGDATWNWGSQKTLLRLANQMAEVGFEAVEIALEVGGEFDGEIRVSGAFPTEQGIFILTFYVTDITDEDNGSDEAKKTGSYCWTFDGDVLDDIQPLATVEAAVEIINAGPPDLDTVDFPEGEEWLPDDGWLPDGDWSDWFFPGNAVINYRQICQV